LRRARPLLRGPQEGGVCRQRGNAFSEALHILGALAHRVPVVLARLVPVVVARRMPVVLARLVPVVLARLAPVVLAQLVPLAVLLNVLPQLGHLLETLLFPQLREQHGAATKLGARARKRVVLFSGEYLLLGLRRGCFGLLQRTCTCTCSCTSCASCTCNSL